MRIYDLLTPVVITLHQYINKEEKQTANKTFNFFYPLNKSSRKEIVYQISMYNEISYRGVCYLENLKF